MGRNPFLSKEIGVPLVMFLWKWKLVSTAALVKKFFPKHHPYSGYNRLILLKRAGLISFRTNPRGEYYIWSLAKSGFNAIQDLLPALKEEGYASEASTHDWLTTAFHLGEWLVETPSGVETFSEQQLRRIDPEHYPLWVPKDLSHRPDGYWHRSIRGVDRTIALEMEISRKKASEYQGIGSFYGEQSQISRVLWVVRSKKDATEIERQLAKAPGSRTQIHSFVLLKPFLQNGWSAKIEHGPGMDLTILSFLEKALAISENVNVVYSSCNYTTSTLLETRKTGNISGTSGNRSKVDFSV